jgi:hypothetical protein
MSTDPAADPDPAPTFPRDREDRMDHGDPRDREVDPSGSTEDEPEVREGGPSSGASGDWREGTPG